MKARKISRLLAALLCLLLLSGLAGCGEIEPEIGTYLCLELSRGGIPLDAPESRLQLDRGGYARLELEGEGGSVHWSHENGRFRLKVDGETLEGTWEDGVIRLTSPEGLTMLYVREGLAEAWREKLAQERETVSAWQARWAGDWYGWWRLDNSEGALADTWYDLCARLTAQPDGSLYLLLWDEDQSASRPMGEARLRMSGENGAAAEEGYFWLQALEETEWTLQLGDGRITLAGRHDAGGERFDYSLCLRPWGERWAEPNERPYYYESWYLPLIEAGKAMPDRMTVEKLK